MDSNRFAVATFLGVVFVFSVVIYFAGEAFRRWRMRRDIVEIDDPANHVEAPGYVGGRVEETSPQAELPKTEEEWAAEAERRRAHAEALERFAVKSSDEYTVKYGSAEERIVLYRYLHAERERLRADLIECRTRPAGMEELTGLVDALHERYPNRRVSVDREVSRGPGDEQDTHLHVYIRGEGRMGSREYKHQDTFSLTTDCQATALKCVDEWEAGKRQTCAPTTLRESQCQGRGDRWIG